MRLKFDNQVFVLLHLRQEPELLDTLRIEREFLHDFFVRGNIPAGQTNSRLAQIGEAQSAPKGDKFTMSAVLNIDITAKTIFEFNRARRVTLTTQVGAIGKKRETIECMVKLSDSSKVFL